MSATLNAELFSNYFGGAPMIHIPVSLRNEILNTVPSFSIGCSFYYALL